MRTLELTDEQIVVLYRQIRAIRIVSIQDEEDVLVLYGVYKKLCSAIDEIAAEDGNPDVS